MPLLSLASFPKAIVHMDCDAFFTSVEQSLNPHLKGRPVVTGKERGIVACASYEAKALGVKRPMRLFEAKKICPSLICLPSDYESYSLYSKRLFDILRRFTPDVEEYSIDEAFADITGLRRVHHTSYEQIALQMKQAVERELGITVSLGLSPTKAISKICSKEKKPAGFVCIKGYEIEEFFKKIPTERVCGFGPNAVALLAKHGVVTVLDYIARPQTFAQKLLGKIGSDLWRELRGEAVHPIVLEEKPNRFSLGKTKTFTPPSNDRDFVRAQLLRNTESAFIRLRRHSQKAGWLSIHLTDKDYGSRGLEVRLTRPTSSTLEIAGIVSELFDRLFDPAVFYRNTGLVLGELSSDRELQHDLFEDPCRIQSLRELSRVIDKANAAYGKHALHLGATDCLRKFGQHLGNRGDIAERKLRLLPGETFRQHLRVPVWNVKV
jgi:DNA polymerase-4/DNA polymerase V